MSNTDNKQVDYEPFGPEWIKEVSRLPKSFLIEQWKQSRLEVQKLRQQSPSASVGSEGLRLIGEERKRQIEVEGWTPEHDADHKHGELAIAAACYAVEHTDSQVLDQRLNEAWPWDEKWWKPKGEIKNLVRAGALIAAEIDRLQSLTPKE